MLRPRPAAVKSVAKPDSLGRARGSEHIAQPALPHDDADDEGEDEADAMLPEERAATWIYGPRETGDCTCLVGRVDGLVLVRVARQVT